MATAKKKTVKQKSKPETVREKAAKGAVKRAPRKRKLPGSTNVHKGKNKLGALLTQSVQTHNHTEDSKVRHLTKHRSITPKYFRNSVSEIRNVVWPSFPEALRLTFAVIVFAAAFSILVYGLDKVLDVIFEELILNESQNIKEFIKNIF